MNIPRKNPNIIWLVRLLVATGLTMVATVIGLIGWRLNSIRRERLQIERQREDMDRSSQVALRQAAEVRHEILKTLGVMLAAQTASRDEAGAIANGDQDSEKLAASPGGSSPSAPLDRIKVLTDRMVAIAQLTRDWRRRYEPYWQDVAQRQTVEQVRHLMMELQRKVELLQTQRQLQSAAQLKLWQAAQGEEAAQLARTILLEQGENRDRGISEFRNELTKLAQATEQLGHEERPDVLVDLKDQILKPLFDRLSLALASFPDSSSQLEYGNVAVARALEDLKVAVFGQGYTTDGAQQTIQATADGLYMKRHDIQLLKLEYENLRREQAAVAHKIELATIAYAQAAQSRSETVAMQMQSSLVSSWWQMLAFGAGCSVLFLWLARVISRKIRDQVTALQQAESTAESEREVAHRLLREQQAAAEDLKRLADALQASEGFLHSLVDSLPVFIFRKDRAGRITFANQRFSARVGRTQDQLIGKSAFDLLAPAEAERQHQLDEHIMASGENYESTEEETTVGGEPSFIHLIKVPVFDAARQCVGVQGMFLDVTERKRAEEKLEQLHQQLMDASRQAGMAEIATGVLHNVGNVLNSVNVSATLVANHVRHTKTASVAKLATMFREHKDDLPGFLTKDPRGQMIPGYLDTLTESLAAEQQAMIAELEQLRKNIDHIKDIVAMQQSYARTSGVIESVSLPDLVEDALRMNASSLARHDVELVRDFQFRPVLSTDKHKIVQILINLVRNAKYACDESGRTDKRITVRIAGDAQWVRVSVSDNGVGIPAENLTRIFNHGFTTRQTGHGFGLHSGALAAKELGGALSVSSDGPGHGATFTLELPFHPEPSSS